MKKETKHIIRTLGTILFILYVLALILFFCSFQKNTEEQQWKKDSTDIIWYRLLR